jgi:hypothetical protein
MKTLICYFTGTGNSLTTAQKFCCVCLHFCPEEAIQLNILPGTTNRQVPPPDLTVEKRAKPQGVANG